jgi:type I restriction enzyme S subunit
MTRDLDPYPSYRSTGSPDFPEIPNHWSFARLRQFCSFNPSKSEAQEEIRNGNSATFLPMEAVSSTGDIRVTDMRPASDLAQGFTYFRRNDVLVAKITPCYENGKGAFLNRLPTEIGFGSTEFIVLRAGPGLDAEYLYLLTMTPQFRERGAISMTGSAGQQRVPLDFVRNYEVPLPPLEEQERIARFAKYANSRFARLIRNKRRLIALLNEEKQAIIQQAVTRGLDPDAPMKPSGVAWLGEIPAHWEVSQLRRHWSVTDCKHLTVPFVDEGIPLASVAEVRGFELDLTHAKQTSREWYEHLVSGNRAPRRGDLIYCRNVSVGNCSYVHSDEVFAMGQDVCLIRSQQQNQRYLNYLLHSEFMADQLARLLLGSTFRRINVSQILSLLVLVPSVLEQGQIASWLDARTREIDQALAIIKQEIDLIREYRTRLIADVVTGQIDVREAAAGLPEIAPEAIDALLSEADESDEAADLGDEGDESEQADAAD